MRLSQRLALLTLALALALALGCDVAGTQTYRASGSLLAVDHDALQLRIAHADIPGFMPAMTMSFEVASAELLAGLEPGTEIEFELERAGTLLRITAIRTTGRSRAGVSGPAPALEPPRGLAPDFELVDHDGAALRLGDLRGNAVLLDFIFTRCAGPCPIQTSRQVALQRALPDRVAEHTRFVSISLDPEYDTPEALRRYAEERGADLSRWRFLTGEPARVHDVVASYHVGSTPGADGQLEHTRVTFLIDPAGRIARHYLGTTPPREQMLDDLRRSLAGPGGVGASGR